MSIEEKAKAYDEALERAKKYMAKGYDVLMPEIFPELRESEDERIRKGLIEVVSDIAGSWPFEEHKITKKEALAYLEKQKEYKPTSFNEPYNPDDYKVVMEGNATSLKRKEQKPIEDVVKDITKNKESAIKFLKSAGIMDDNGELAEIYRSEQKPAENGTRAKIISKASNEKQVVLLSESDGNAEIGWDTRSLEDTKKLLEYGIAFINKQLGTKPAEWSEEDERIIKDAIYALEEVGGYPCTVKRLKSLRPQSNWKPSEEQMEELWNVISYVEEPSSNFLGVPELLESLYEQLKKL